MIMTRIMRRLREFQRNESGATAIEYALIASGIAGVIMAVVFTVGASVQGKYQTVNDAMNPSP
jgi:pilus assembly protein Flp/PilA